MRARPVLFAVLAAALAGGAAPAPAKAPAKAAAPSSAAEGLTVKVGVAAAFTRLEFHGGAGAVVRQDARTVVLRFAEPGAPDLTRLLSPPKRILAASPRPTAGGLELTLKLAEGAVAKIHKGDGALTVHVADGPTEAATQAAPPPATPTPAGPLKLHAQAVGRGLELKLEASRSPGLAVFRRGDAVWIVVDGAGKLDAAALPIAPGVRSATALNGPGYAALRLTAAPDVIARAVPNEHGWTVTVAPGRQAMTPVVLRRDKEAFAAQFPGATAVRTLRDPVVGDTLTVVTALGPARGLSARREYVDFALLPSAHGLALEAPADGLAVSLAGEQVRIGRAQGLALSAAAGGGHRADAAADAPARTSLPGLIDFDAWGKTSEGGFVARYAALQAAAAEPTGPAAHEPKLALARFLLGSELAHEALGVLNGLRREDGALASDGEHRALHGAANAMAGRWKEAQADLSVPALAADPASALWRGYAAQKLGDAEAATTAFAQGAPALKLFAPKWRARFARAAGEAALAQGDHAAARRALAAAAAEQVEPGETEFTLLAQAKLLAAENNPNAVAAFLALARSSREPVAAPALLAATELRLAAHAIPLDEAAATLRTLRWRWRGGEVELNAVRALGRLHLDQGQYRDGLAALRSAAAGLKDSDTGLALQGELLTVFRQLFLEGGADALQPIQALGLFYDFRDAVPIGADGDLMVRRLAARLVDVDLLPQAAELLRYQAFERLDGAPRAQVATDLALVLLMDRRPEEALSALNTSRTTLAPPPLAAERRVIEARALAALGRADHALEILEADGSADALDVRAEIAWAAGDWKAAGPLLERALGERWRAPGLSPADEARLIRAGAAYSLAEDGAALARLRSRWGARLEAGRRPEALRVALAGVGDDPTALTRAGAADPFPSWVEAMKARLRQPTATPPPAKQAAAPAPATRG